MGAGVEPCMERQNDGAVLADGKVREILYSFLRVSQILYRRQDHGAMIPSISVFHPSRGIFGTGHLEMAGTNVVAGGLDDETDWELANLTRGLDLHTGVSIRYD